MKALVVAATEFEIKDFTSENTNTDLLITGVGVPSTMYKLTQKLLQTTYDLVVQAGIAGVYNNEFSLGKVVLINEDTFADIGIDENGHFKTLFETGFINENDFPFTNGWLQNDHAYFKHSHLPVAKAVTVNKIIDDAVQIKKMSEKFAAGVESMEGAAFHYVCLQQKTKFLQLRSISNFVGERDKTKWKMKEAITNLNAELKKLLQQLL